MANYEDKLPKKIRLDQLTDVERLHLIDNKYFCMLPWTHIHAYPNGDAYPCCLADHQQSIGSMREQTIEELWNNVAMKSLRRNMLKGKSSKTCVKLLMNEWGSST